MPVTGAKEEESVSCPFLFFLSLEKILADFSFDGERPVPSACQKSWSRRPFEAARIPQNLVLIILALRKPASARLWGSSLHTSEERLMKAAG